MSDLQYPPKQYQPKFQTVEEACMATLGALRQDVRALLAAVARLEIIVGPAPPQGASECNCHTKDWAASE